MVGGGGDGGLLCLPFEFLLGSFWGVPWQGFGGLLNFVGRSLARFRWSSEFFGGVPWQAFGALLNFIGAFPGKLSEAF